MPTTDDEKRASQTKRRGLWVEAIVIIVLAIIVMSFAVSLLLK